MVFLDISGIETVESGLCMQGITIGYSRIKAQPDFDDFLKDLESAKSNLPNINGRT